MALAAHGFRCVAGCVVCVGVAMLAFAAVADDGEEALALIAKAEPRLEALEKQLEAARSKGIPVPYPRVDLEVARMFCQYCRDDAAHGRKARALEVAKEVMGLLDRAESEMRFGVDVPVWQGQRAEIRDGAFWSTCALGAGEREQPVYFTGFGHFAGVVSALPTLQRLGLNIIQIEIGPSRVLTAEDVVDTSGVEEYVIAALDRAQAHGACVCLLVSPHYFPRWALEKWPELAVDNGMFLKNSLEAPQSRAIYEKFLRTVIPMIKDHPALHSFCLSNEPTSSGSDKDPWRLPLWHAYIEAKHKDIAVLNKLYDTSYARFEEVPHPSRSLGANRSAYYDAIRFNQERFAEWHAWMVEIIHEYAPDIPCHAKVMPLVWGRRTISWGTDPWDFAELSQLNGNDCYFLPNSETEPWESEWQVQNMYYDLQRSMKRVPVFNTENHIISDRETEYVNPSHIYTALWQGAIHGQGAETTWAWGRTYDRKSDFEGLILHRAGCMAAHCRAGLDLMRLAREVTAVQRHEPKVALLWSNAAIVYDNDYHPSLGRAYEALNFCGVPVGFVTEEQAAAGWLDKYDCLVVPGCRHVLAEAADAIRAFRKRGVVLGYGNDLMRYDEYGRRIKRVKTRKTYKPEMEGEALRDAFLKVLRKEDVVPEPALTLPGGGVPYGVEWRSAELDGQVLLNVVNLTRDPVDVVMPDGNWKDLITGKAVGNTVVLEPNVPVLARREK